MPYDKKADLPDAVRELPDHAAEIWMSAFNAAFKQYNDDAKAAATAWAAVKKAGYKKGEDGKWVQAKETAVEAALVELSVFGAEAKPVVTAVAESDATVTVGDKTYAVPYVEKGGAFVFGTAKETQPDESFSLAKESERVMFTVAEDGQHKSDPAAGDWPVVIIEEGENPKKRRRYTAQALETADVDKYVGLPMHLDHAGAEGDTRPRSVRDMVGVVKRAWRGVSESGKRQICGMVHVFDPWLKERLQDTDFRKLVGLSHVADIAGRVQRAGRVATQVVESIVLPQAVDWVNKAAFGGRVAEAEDVLTQRSDDLMALETLTEQDLERERPDLVKAIGDKAAQSFKAQALESEAVDEATQKMKDAEARAKAAEAKLRETQVRIAAAEEAAKPDHKVPEPARAKLVDRITDRLASQEIAPDKVSETVAEAVKSELEFAGAFATPTKVTVTGGDADSGKTVKETLQAAADAMFGVHTKKES